MMNPSRPLAILGATPAFQEPLHVGRPNIGSQAKFNTRVEQIFNCRWLTNDGPMVKEFERRISNLVGVKHCIAICNATVALEIAIRAAGLGGEVIVPSYTFIATAHALQWQQITPLFCDLDPATHNIDPDRIEALITPRTTGILATHVWGRPCEVEALQQIADQHGLKLLFDAAHAFGCSHHQKMIGGFGEAEVFSFHATKFINSFEGGAVVTNNDELAETMRYMRNFGFADMDRVDYIGTNGKMSEISAAMGLTSLESMDDFIRHNRENYLEYQRNLAEVPGICLRTYDGNERNNYQYIVIEIDERVTGICRDALVATLTADHVLARKYFWPGCHRMQPYRMLYPDSSLHLEQTESVSAGVIVLPTGTAVSQSDIGVICGILQSAVYHSERIQVILKNR